MLGTFVGIFVAIAIASPAAAETALNRALPPRSNARAPLPTVPQKRKLESMGMKTSARSAFVADVASGSVLYAKDPHRVSPIASLTKLVTAMVFLDQKPDLAKRVTIEEVDEDIESKVILEPHDEFTQGELLNAMLVGSVNAAANALARTSLGTEKFVEAMNVKMRQLGLRSPMFVDVSGLDPNNRAHAADVAAIISTALRYPEIREATKRSEISIVSSTTKKEFRIKSTNFLLSSYLNQKPYSILLAKTGSLPRAGFCMAQVTKNAEGHEVVAVELGSENTFSRFQDIKALTAWAFDAYRW